MYGPIGATKEFHFSVDIGQGMLLQNDSKLS